MISLLTLFVFLFFLFLVFLFFYLYQLFVSISYFFFFLLSYIEASEIELVAKGDLKHLVLVALAAHKTGGTVAGYL